MSGVCYESREITLPGETLGYNDPALLMLAVYTTFPQMILHQPFTHNEMDIRSVIHMCRSPVCLPPSVEIISSLVSKGHSVITGFCMVVIAPWLTGMSTYGN